MTKFHRTFSVGVIAIAILAVAVPAMGMTANDDWVVLYGEDQWEHPVAYKPDSEVTTITFTIEVKDDDRVDVELRNKDGELLRIRNDVKKAEIIWYVDSQDGVDRLVVKRVDTDYSTKFNWGLRVWDPSKYEDNGGGPSWWDRYHMEVLTVTAVLGVGAITAAAFAGPFTELSPSARLQAGFLRFFKRVPPH